MLVNNISKMKAGWFVGNFEPTAWWTDNFEVCYKVHKKGDKWPTHYHKKAVEINHLIRGCMILQEKELHDGDIFVIQPYEIANPVFITDCELVVIKTPSVPGDKYIVDEVINENGSVLKWIVKGSDRLLGTNAQIIDK